MSIWAFTASSNAGFHFRSQFSRYVDSNKVTKRCLNALTLNFSYTWAWSLLICLGLCGNIFELI